MAGSLGVVVMGLVSRLSLAGHLAWPTTQGPSLWREQLPAKTDSSMKDPGRLVRHIMGGVCSLLLAPPEFSQLVFCASTKLLIRRDLLV